MDKLTDGSSAAPLLPQTDPNAEQSAQPPTRKKLYLAAAILVMLAAVVAVSVAFRLNIFGAPCTRLRALALARRKGGALISKSNKIGAASEEQLQMS